MRTFFKITSVIICGLCSLQAYAGNYLGLDYKLRGMRGKRTDTYTLRQILPREYQGGELYYMYRSLDNVGVNLSYEQSENKKRVYTFNSNQMFLGDLQIAGDRTETHTRVKAVNFDVVGFYSFTDKFEAVGHLGLAVMQARISGYIFNNGTKRSTDLSASKNWRILPRIAMDLQYFFFKRLGLHGQISWTNTNVYRIKITDEDGVRRNIKAFEQSYAVSLGLITRF